MYIPKEVVDALKALPDSPHATTIRLHYGPQQPKWILEYDRVVSFDVPGKVIRYLLEMSPALMVPKAALSVVRKHEQLWLVSYPVRTVVEVA